MTNYLTTGVILYYKVKLIQLIYIYIFEKKNKKKPNLKIIFRDCGAFYPIYFQFSKFYNSP